MSQLEREWSKAAKKGINFNQRTGSLLHLVQSLKASLKTRSPSLCVKGPTVRVQLEDFDLVLDDFVQAFSPQSFQAVVALPCSGSQTSRWLTGTNIEHLFQKAFSKVLLVLVFAPVPELGRVSHCINYQLTIAKPQF